MESITREEIERRINATDSEDALKYFPSLLVRKRYIGDYNHAILSSRASGTGNSARSAVYADGILLSNYLGNGVGGLSFPPRWGLVTPEEIERVDVMYGPFSAAYPGNSVGAVVDYVTRMPTRFEAHAQGRLRRPALRALQHQGHLPRAGRPSASLGNRAGDWAWWLNVNRTDSEGQPLTFATRLLSSGATSRAGTPVTGAVRDANNANQPWFVLGAGTQYRTVQDHLKVKLAYDLTPTLRASYMLGVWQQRRPTATRRPTCAMPRAAGLRGPINIEGLDYPAPADGRRLRAHARRPDCTRCTACRSRATPRASGTGSSRPACTTTTATTSGRTRAANPLPGALGGGAGTLADGSGTGWNTLAAKGIWRPPGADGAHIVDFGVQLDRYKLRYLTSTITRQLAQRRRPARWRATWRARPRCNSAWAQDVWRFAPRWKAVLGGRFEHWKAYEGRTDFSATSSHHPSDAQRALLLAQGRAVVAVGRRHRAQGLDRTRRALADGARAVRRHLDGQLAVHQRPEPASPRSRGPPNSAARRTSAAACCA